MEATTAEAFLQEIHAAIRLGKRHRYFVPRTYDDASYLELLSRLGLSGVDEAWEYVLQLQASHQVSGPSFDRDDRKSGRVVRVFKMEVNGILTYIKLKNELHIPGGRGCVCLSFHEDFPRERS